MKRFTKLFAIVLVFISCFAFSSCIYRERVYEKLNAVQAEVDYGFIHHGYLSTTVNQDFYNYLEMAEKLLKKKYDYFHRNGRIGDDVYFCYYYDEHGDIRIEGDRWYNEQTYDVALIRVNRTSLTAEIVYDFKGLYPSDSRSPWPTFLSIIDENRAVIQYNGYIQILDLKNKIITDSILAYDKDEYRLDLDKENFYFNSYGDYYVRDGAILRYYELDGYKFKLHEYAIDSYSYCVERYKNYVYTPGITDKTVYYGCYNLITDEPYDVELVLDMIAEENSSTPPERAPIQIGENAYYIDEEDGELIISDLSEQEIVCINEAYMIENSAKFNELYDLWTDSHYGYSNVDYYVTDGKLFVGFWAYYYPSYNTPMYVYEYAIETGEIKYVGYIKEHGFWEFLLIEKSE